MKIFARTTLALALCGSALPVLAADGFTGEISFDKPDYPVHDTVIMSLSGVGMCKNFVADWGDGVKTTIISYAFSSDGPLHLQHKYLNAGTFYPSIKATLGPTLPEQCGSRSGSVKILATGKVTGVTASPGKVQPGETITVTVNGTGQCEGQMAVTYNTQPLGSQNFAADAPWPRVATFKLTQEGDYYFNVYNHADGGYANTGGCWSATQPKVEVKKTVLKIEPVVVIATQPVLVGTAPSTPAKPAASTPKKPCKKPGKPGVGEDCNTD